MAVSKDTDYQNFLTREEVIIVLRNALKTTEFILNDFTIKSASDKPMGFLGVHGKILANVTLKDQKPKQISFFAKKVPEDVPSHLEYARKTRAFYKEIELYRTCFADLADSLKDPEKSTKWHPEYYYSRGQDIFVLEDLSVLGFGMVPERTLLDEDHIRAGIKVMAAMHAGSFIFEELFNAGKIGTRSEEFVKSGDKRAEIGDIYQHLTFETEASDIPGHPGNTFCEAGIRSELCLVDLLPGYTSQEREIIRRKLPEELRQMMRMSRPSNKYKNVMVHGDLWSNNLLFRKNPDGVVEAVILDFQLGRLAPPAHDICMFLHLCQNKEFRDQKGDEMIKYYYNCLKEELAREDLQVEKLLPWDVFLESCEYYYELGLNCSVLYFQLILTPGELTNKFMATPELFDQNFMVDRSELIKECYLKDEICNKRVTEVLNDLIKRYIL